MVDRRQFIVGAAGVGALAVMGALPANAADTAVSLENQRAGSSAWQLMNPAGDDLAELGAYCRQDSVRRGERVDVCVLTRQSTTVSASVFRLGWYGGDRARLVREIGTTAVPASPMLSTDSTTGATGAQASPSLGIMVGDDWVSGIYLIRVEAASGVDTHATFVVRDDRVADIVLAQPILTYAAYTNTPTPLGKSLYDGDSGGAATSRGTQRATEISLDRPYRNSGSGDLFRWDHDNVSWLEQQGYDVSYVTNLDIDRNPATLQRGRIAVVSGHDEYWTQTMMDGYLAARNAGVSIANLGANNAYWRVRLEAAADGRDRRRIICWKYAPGESGEPTVLFKDTATPMQGLWGVDFMDYASYDNGPYSDIVPTATDHWFWAGTGALEDQELPCPIMGYEVDRRNYSLPLPDNTEYTLLASSPFDGIEKDPNWAHAVLYRAPGGAWVFSAGTISWAWGLMREGRRHSAIERATRNLLDRMLADSMRPAPVVAPTVANASTIDEILRAADYTGADAAILRLYRAFFGREPDIDGAKYWLAEARQGTTNDTIGYGFAASAEFELTYGALADRAFLDVVYRNVLDRPPDAGGSAYWLDQMQSGLTRHRVVMSFSDSEEFVKRFPYSPQR